MFYNKHPFLAVGLPFLSAVLVGTVLLVEIRKSRYETNRISPPSHPVSELRSLKTLEEELSVNVNVNSILTLCVFCFLIVGMGKKSS